MGRNARRRHGELPTGWNFTRDGHTEPIRTVQDFHAALTWLMEDPAETASGGDHDPAEKETA
jgi:hypothetical protein